MLISPIQFNHARADLIRQCAIFIWEEAPMANRSVFECVEDTCQRVTQSNLPFGNKYLYFLAIFVKHVLSYRAALLSKSLMLPFKTSPLWRHFKIRPLPRTLSVMQADPDLRIS